MSTRFLFTSDGGESVIILVLLTEPCLDFSLFDNFSSKPIFYLSQHAASCKAQYRLVWHHNREPTVRYNESKNNNKLHNLVQESPTTSLRTSTGPLVIWC